jgi:hypothetical protein
MPTQLFLPDVQSVGMAFHSLGWGVKPYWTVKINMVICPLYDCCINKKRIEHCGLCGELPCQLFQSFHDPALTSEEAEKAVLIRRNNLLRRKAVGTVKWLSEKAGGNKK